MSLKCLCMLKVYMWPSFCVRLFQRGQLWTGCADSGELCLWQTNNHRRPSKRISLPGSSGVTCMIRVKDQVSCATCELTCMCMQTVAVLCYLYFCKWSWFFFVFIRVSLTHCYLSLMPSPPLRSGWAVVAGAMSEASVTVSVMVSWEVRCWWWTQRATPWQRSCRPIQTASRHSAPLRIATSWVALHAAMVRSPSGQSSRERRQRAQVKQKRNMWRGEKNKKGTCEDIHKTWQNVCPFEYLTVSTRSSCGRLTRGRQEDKMGDNE